MYFQTYMERRQPDIRLFAKLESNLRTYGCFSKPKHSNINFREEDEERVLAYVNYKPTTSTREISTECAVSVEQVRLVLKQNHFQPYKYHVSNTLYPNDNQRRLEYCRWLLGETDNDANFPKSILFTDESRFTNNGVFNRHNHIYWAQENPHLAVERRDQRSFSVNVWCGILGEKIIGPYFFNGNLNGERYLAFLQNELEDMLDNMPLNLVHNLRYFQHDGAPAHNSRIVSQYLNQRFPRWIGNMGPVPWPARSPDLTPLDYFLWGAIKNKVYLQKPNDLEELKNNITAAIRNIRRQSIQAAVQREMVRRCQMCIDANGGHFEHHIN